MLHITFPGNRPAGSREGVWMVFTINGRGGHLGLGPRCNEHTFVPLHLEALHKIWLKMAKRIQRKVSFNFD